MCFFFFRKEPFRKQRQSERKTLVGRRIFQIDVATGKKGLNFRNNQFYLPKGNLKRICVNEQSTSGASSPKPAEVSLRRRLNVVIHCDCFCQGCHNIIAAAQIPSLHYNHIQS
jgi:hypothetical protein